MRRMAILALAIMALALLTGCPFESDVPLGAPGPGSLDPKLLGAWTSTDETGSVADVEFIPFNKYEYYVELREEGKGQPERYRAYTVKVGDQPFLNISELKQETAPATFYFARSPRRACWPSTWLATRAFRRTSRKTRRRWSSSWRPT